MIKDVEILDIKQKRKNGMSIADIALETGYCQKTIGKWLKHDGPPRYSRAKRPSKLDPYTEYIMKRMADGVFNCEVLFREIKQQGYSGGKTILKDFVLPFRRQFKVQAVRRFETPPGRQAQVDWGYLGTFDLDGRKRKVWAFVMVLGYSRYMAVHCTTAMDLETLLLCHQKCFESLGGVTEQIVYDNMKTVTLGRDVDNRPLWQKRFIDFALYYGFQPVACTPYRPRSKGKVESCIGYIKDNFCSGRQFADITDLNKQLEIWLNTVANVRVHGTTYERPVDRLIRETLSPVPRMPFPTFTRFARKVSRDGFFSYEGVLYSVPWQYAGAQVEVEERVGSEILVWWHSQLVAEHVIPQDGSRRVCNPMHMAGLPTAQRLNRSSGLKQCYPEVQERPLSVYDRLVEVS